MDRNEMLRQQVMNSLFSKVDPKFDVPLLPDQPVSTSPNSPGDVYFAIMETLEKVKGMSKPKTTYCSWAFFVRLLMAGNNTITDGHFLSKSSWRFELDDCIDFIVSEVIPIDEKAFQFKN